MYAVMPAIAVLMARTLDLPHGTGPALVVLAICAGAPLVPKKLIKFGGDPAYVFSLIVTTSLLAIVTVPASLHVLDKVITFDTSAWPCSLRPTRADRKSLPWWRRTFWPRQRF